MSTLGERIRYVRESLLRTKQGELAELLGFNRIATISDYEKDKRCPDIETLCKLAELGSVSIEWLLTGKNSPIGISKEILRPADTQTVSDKDLLISVYDKTASAPFGQFPNAAPALSMCVCKKRINEGYIAFTIQDESMAPLMANGSIVCINTNDRAIYDNAFFAVYLPEEGVIIRRLLIKNNTLELVPENNSYKTVSIHLDNITSELILGKIKWLYQTY